ncbi:AMP-binding protein [Kocuria sp. CPCC 205292]|uniref:AMP-binding protein n=1 Tax=Kocuria cellulosilytica TaxID=3071451 RepID=UPI0034D4C4E5
MRTIHQLFEDAVERHGEKALSIEPDGRRLTYAAVHALTEELAGTLTALGVRPGDRVAVKTEKLPEVVALYLATLRVGAIYLPLNTAYTGSELRYFVEDARPALFVCTPGEEEELAGDSPDGVRYLSMGPHRTGTLFAQGSARPGPPAAVDLDAPAAILYTSGTTGRSKGAVLTHRNLASNCATLTEAWQYTHDDVLVHALPIFHIHGLFVAVNMSVTTGATMHFLPKFDPQAVLDLMPEATVLMGVPTFYTRLLRHPDLTAERARTVRLFVSGSAPLTAETHHEWQDRTGHAILERYGMTETGMMCSNPYAGERRAGTVGPPLPGISIRVAERGSSAELPAGEVGSIQVAGPNVFREYWNQPEKTAEEFTDDGFFVTGDLGVVDDDGYLAIVGRDKDLIISGGYNIYPKEIEELIDEHPAVRESAVVGVPHPDLGEVPVAVVVPQGGAPADAEEILETIRPRLARFKQPRRVEFAGELPRNVMGKIQKAALRQEHAALFQQAPTGPKG